MRTLLTAPTTFYVSPAGNDITGEGTASNPWATPGGAYDNLQRNFDMGGIAGHQVSVAPHNAYTTELTASGPLVGQNDVLVFIGSPANPVATVIRPVKVNGASKFVVNASHGAMIYLDGFCLDESFGGLDIVEAAQGGTVVAFGRNIIFSNAAPGFNVVTASHNATITFASGFTVYARSIDGADGAQSLLFTSLGGMIAITNDGGQISAGGIAEIVFIGNPKFQIAMYADGGNIDIEGVHYTDNFIGKSYQARAGGVINAYNSQSIPGTIAGTLHSGGQYITTSP